MGLERQALALFILSLSASFFTLLLSVLAAHLLLEPQSYSSFTTLYGLWSIIAVPTTGIQLISARHLAFQGQPGGAGGAGFVAQSQHWMLTLLWISLPALLALSAGLAPRLHLDATLLFLILLEAWGMGLWVAWLRGRAQAQNLLSRFGQSLALEALLRPLVLAALLHLGWSVGWSFLGAMLLARAPILWRLPPRLLTLDTHAPRLNALAGQVQASLLLTVSSGVMANLDLLWARQALPQSEAGLFAAGVLTARPFALLGAVATTVALPRLASGAWSAHTLWRACVLLLFLGAVLALLIGVCASWLAPALLGLPFAQAASTMRWAAWGGAVLAPCTLLSTGLLALGYTRESGYFSGAAALLGVGAFLLARTSEAYWLWYILVWAIYLVQGGFLLGRLVQKKPSLP